LWKIYREGKNMSDKKIVAVAGASSGVGRAVVLHLGQKGYGISLCARRKELVQEIAGAINEKGGDAIGVKADMSVWDEADGFIKRTVEKFGRIDVLMNNMGAGIRFTDYENMSIEEIRSGVDVNLVSVLYACRSVLPVMIKQGRGYIINVSSILGKRARAGFAVYTAAKHGVEGFSRALFNELKKHNIRVSVISPAVVNTDWAKKAGVKTSFAEGKVIEPEDIAAVVEELIEMPDHITLWNVDIMARPQMINPL
jgi:NADP-dependent 3-hydroxy acid dehydrogenase YdfG